ncbi:uncharacterized protein LOC141901217 [Tubulanus polymorphus]|uniref:uncharacterized protein LOC141901217 n=1 Tax=Tubulanus polymorphus TaxID=672921 RepID=UPI003DA5FE19
MRRSIMSWKVSMCSAIRTNNLKQLEELVNLGIDISQPIPFDPCSRDMTRMEILIDYRMYTPISIAIECGNIEMLSFLLKSGANYKVRSTETSFHSQILKFEPLYQACRLHKYDMVDSILKAGADANGFAFNVIVMDEEEGGSMNYSHCNMRYIDLALENHDVELLTVLLNNGANPNLILENSSQFLDFVEESLSDFKFLQMLIESGFGSPFVLKLEDLFNSIAQSLLHGWDGKFSAKLQLVNLLYLLGYKARTESVKVHENLLRKLSNCNDCRDIRLAIINLQKNPRRLNETCRIVIRNQLSEFHFNENLRKLPLPDILLDYLTMKDFF